MNIVTPQKGYTFLEVLIVIVIIGILASWALSSWSTVIGNTRQRTLINDYHTLFSFGRWQAASISGIVTICPLSSEQQCIDDWSLPVHVFADQNRDGKPDEQIIRTMPAPGSRSRARSRTAGSGYIRFADNGMVHGRTGGIVLCTPGASTELVYLAVNKGGRFRAEYDRDRDGRILTASGDSITC